jgi:hypothetical protein
VTFTFPPRGINETETATGVADRMGSVRTRVVRGTRRRVVGREPGVPFIPSVRSTCWLGTYPAKSTQGNENASRVLAVRVAPSEHDHVSEVAVYSLRFETDEACGGSTSERHRSPRTRHLEVERRTQLFLGL